MSPRRRKNKEDDWLPPRVYPSKYGYHWQPKTGGKVRIAPPDASKAAVIRAYDKAVEDHRRDTFGVLADEYLASAQFRQLSVRSQRDYQKIVRSLKDVFGKARIDDIEPRHVRRFMDLKGEKAPVSANRHLAVMSTIFAWGYERGLARMNPCKGVRRHKEAARDRYVEDWEYQAVYGEASALLRAAMEISYLCAARKGDVLRLQRQALRPEGIFIRQGKTGVKQIKEWTPRLRAAVDLGLNSPASQPTMFVIHTRTGTPMTESGLQAHWKAAMTKAKEKHPDLAHFTFHDLKAKGISDYEDGDKREFSGHKTERQVASYDRKVKVTPTLDPGKKKGK